MAQATTIKGGSGVRVYLGNDADPIEYIAPCGLTEKSLTLTKNTNDVTIPDCDDPDKVDWVGRDTASLSMEISGNGVLAEESVETWLDAWDSINPVPAKVELIFPAKTITWTGMVHVGSVEIGGSNGTRATANVQIVSDGEMVREVTPAA